MRRLLLGFVVLASAVVTLTTAASSPTAAPPTADALAFRRIDLPTPGPLGPIAIFGDSVMLGSGLFGPTLPDHLAARGWGPIRFQAGGGFNTGTPRREPAGGRATDWVDQWRAEGLEFENLVINLGSNDVGFCRLDTACMRNQIQTLLDRIGPGHHIWWPQMTLETFKRSQQDVWNTVLAEFAAARDDFDTWNWPGELATGPYPTSDNIHLSPSGYRARSARMSQIITARLAEGSPVGAVPALPAPTSEPSRFVAVPQVRLADTRTDPAPTGGRRSTGDVLRVEVGDTVPTGSTAVALHLAAVDTGSPGFLSAAPCGTTSNASSVNFGANTIRGGPAISEIGDDGAVCIRVVGETDVVVDLQGAFHPTDASGLGFDPLDAPRRLHDTRQTGRTSVIRLEAPTGAEAVAINLTTTGQAAPGRLLAAPCGEQPGVASLNYLFDPVVASSAIVEVGDDGTFCVTSTSSVDVIVDLTGSFSDGGALRFVPVVPTRMLDTRTGTGGWSHLHGSAQTLDVRVAPPDATAVTGTVTIVQPLWPAFLAGFPCGVEPATSSVNSTELGFAANSLTTGITNGELCLFASSGTHTLFDTTGWWVS